MSHGPIVLATFAIEFDASAEFACITEGSPTTEVISHDAHGRQVTGEELARLASSEPGSAVSAALLATVSIALTDNDTLRRSVARMGVHSFKFVPSTPSTDTGANPR